ncbi:MAG: WYL domain-containing protein [Smithella sp.]|nr:WYL domain-containing protein [Smithella sp.]
MIIEHNEKKADRLIRIQTILLDKPDGMSIRDVAKKLHVNTNTIWRYLQSGSLEWVGVFKEGEMLKVDRDNLRVNVGLTLHEAMALHLAARLLATRMDRHNPNAASALRKLSDALEGTAEPVSKMMLRSAEDLDSDDQWTDPNYVRSLEILTKALAGEHKVKVWHPSKKTGKIHEYILSPYLIEPYAIGQSTHVIGAIDPNGDLWTLKIERIQKLELLEERYKIPPDFNPEALLNDAWGIWFTGKKPVKVLLRFTPEVAARVRESRWHRSQQCENQIDGSLLWSAEISEPTEMESWIRGWGAEVEVLEPPELRARIAADVKKFAKIYA